MSQTSQAFYVKIRGRSIGPFTTERLRQMAQQGELSRVSMISADGQQWQRAGDFPELFEVPVSTRNHNNKSDRQTDPARTTGANNASDQSQADPQAKSEWYFAEGTDQKGPVTFGRIRGLIQAGTLNANDLVWKEGMADWESIANIPEFSGSVVVVERGRKKRGSSKSNDSDKDLKNTRQIIRSTTPWVYFICIAAYVLAAMLFFGFIERLIVGSRLQNNGIIAQAVVNLLFGGAVLTGAIFLNRYSSAGSRFVANQRISDLNLSMRWLARFWLFIGIVLIFQLTFILLGVIYMIAEGADLSPYLPWTP